VIEQSRWVLDTNVLISRLLTPRGVAASAVDRAMSMGVLLVSDVTLQELTQVLMRPRFDRYISQESRQRFLALLAGVARSVHITRHFQACRDPKDDAFLDLAFNGQARSLVTGDQDLLVLGTFHGTAILTPEQFLLAYPPIEDKPC
jgi:putative PIN family toxin of toxin-antitoxin system